MVAAHDYDLILYQKQSPNHNGTTIDGRKVQIKATFKDKLTFKTVPDYYLGIRLSRDGTYQEIFNGLGYIISDHYAHRKGIGEVLLSFNIEKLEQLSSLVDDSQRIPHRAKATQTGESN